MRRTLLTVVLSLAGCPAIFGAVLVSDDFESSTVGITAVAPWEGVGVAGNFVVRSDETASPFGPNNNWLEAGSFANGNLENGRVSFDGVTLLTVSFDAYFDSSAFPGFMRFAIRGDQAGPESNLTFFDWNGGAADLRSDDGDFSLDTAEHYDLVINITGSPVSYNSTSVEHYTFDVWRDGTLIKDDASLDLNDTNTVVQEIGFWQLGPDVESQVWLDNVVIQDTAFVSGGLSCDFDGDMDCMLDDLAAMYQQQGMAGQFDYDGNGTIGPEDIEGWLAEASTSANGANPDGRTHSVGDLNFDFAVDSTDLGKLLNNFGAMAGTPADGVGWGGGDVNMDGGVDSTDLGRLLNSFGAEGAAASAVPEPASQALLIIAALAALIIVRRD